MLLNTGVANCRAESLPNVNNIGKSDKSSIDLISALNNLEEMRNGRSVAHERRHQSPTSSDRNLHQYHNQHGNIFCDSKRVDSSPYSPMYLSPPSLDTNWRRTHSDSALHQTRLLVEQMHENPQQIGLAPHRSSFHNVDATIMLPSENSNANIVSDVPLMAWDPGKKLIPNFCNQQLLSASLPNDSRPKSCEIPGITIYPTQEDSSVANHHVSFSSNTGSLPDLTTLHLPAPLSTPIDVDDQNLSSNATNLGTNVINQAPCYNTSSHVGSAYSCITSSACNTNSNYAPQTSYSSKSSQISTIIPCAPTTLINHHVNAKVLPQNRVHASETNNLNNSEVDHHAKLRLAQNLNVVSGASVEDSLLRGQDFNMSNISGSFDTNDLFTGYDPPIDFEDLKMLTGITDGAINDSFI